MRSVLPTIRRVALLAAAIAAGSACAYAVESAQQGAIDASPPPEPPARTTAPAQADPESQPAVSRDVNATERDDVAAEVPVEGEAPPTDEERADEEYQVPVEGDPPPAVPAPRDEDPAPEAMPEADWRPAPSGDDILVDADEVYYHSGATIAEGNVVVRYRDITVTSDTAEIDEDGVWGQFRGNVTIDRAGQEATADLIRLNFETEQWEILGARTRFEPEQFERGVEEPIFVRAENISGVGEEQDVEAFDGFATSCDLERPHWGVHSRRVRVIGEEKLVLHDPEVEILGNTIFRLPWDLVLSQQSVNNRFFPELGQNTVEGFYAKFAYLYLTGSELNSYVRLHLTQNRGIGFGGDHYFRTGPHSGEASLFFEPDEGSMSGRLRHNWEIGEGLDSRLNLSLQEHSGYQTATRSLAGNLTLTHRDQLSTSTLGIDRSITDSGAVSSRRFTGAFNHRQRLGDDASWDLRTVLRRSQFGTDTPASEVITADFQYQDRGDWFDWALAAEQEWQTEGDRGQGFRLERLPEVVFNTDSRRLGDWELLGALPFRAQVKAGHMVQYPDEEDISAAGIDLNLGGERKRISDRAEWTTTFNYDQNFFSDGSALYNMGGSLIFDMNFGSHLHTRISHRKSTVEGFSPLRRSYGGVYDYTTLSLVHQYPERSRFELTGGFDYVRDRWRELRLRGWYNASERDRLELVSGYSLDDSRWRPVQVRWTHASPWKIYLALSSTYDLDDEELDRADLEFDWRISDRWQLAGLTSWSGYQDTLDDLSLRLTRDLHCWQASLTYDSDYDEIRLNLGIKAFPFEAQDWTVGRGGARQGSFQQYYY
ncbi:MAG: hypothetical protein ACOCX2_05570 [Armatimonadota bacterium]